MLLGEIAIPQLCLPTGHRVGNAAHDNCLCQTCDVEGVAAPHHESAFAPTVASRDSPPKIFAGVVVIALIATSWVAR